MAADHHPAQELAATNSGCTRVQRLRRARTGTEPIVPSPRNTEPTLTRSDLIADIAADNPHLRQADVELIVATIFDQIADALARGGRVELRGFGAF